MHNSPWNSPWRNLFRISPDIFRAISRQNSPFRKVATSRFFELKIETCADSPLSDHDFKIAHIHVSRFLLAKTILNSKQREEAAPISKKRVSIDSKPRPQVWLFFRKNVIGIGMHTRCHNLPESAKRHLKNGEWIFHDFYEEEMRQKQCWGKLFSMFSGIKPFLCRICLQSDAWTTKCIGIFNHANRRSIWGQRAFLQIRYLRPDCVRRNGRVERPTRCRCLQLKKRGSGVYYHDNVPRNERHSCEQEKQEKSDP